MVLNPVLRLAVVLFLLVGASSGISVAQEVTKLIPESLGVGDRFGRAVALSADGRYAVVGASQADADTTDGGIDAGKVYVFESTVDGWNERQRLVASDPDSLSNFGRAVDITSDGSRIFVGAPYNGFGSVYVFAREGTSWFEEAKIEIIEQCGAPFECRFGWAVAASAGGDVLAVGAPDDGAGSLNIYERGGDAWKPVAKLTANGGSFVGIDIALSGNGKRAFAGTHHCCGSGQTGIVYVFDESNGTWGQSAELRGHDMEPDNRFGNELAVTSDGNWLLVGADGASDVGSSSGAAYLFERGEAEWVERLRLTASDAEDQDFFGSSVALAADANILVIGALGLDAQSLDTGGAYVFVRSGSMWGEHAILVPADLDERDFFGSAISVTSTASHALFGVWAADDRGDASGSAYIYEGVTVGTERTATYPDRTLFATIYPNPSDELTTVELTLFNFETVELALYDLLGRAIGTFHAGDYGPGEHRIALSVGHLSPGIYIVRLETKTGSWTRRLTVL